MRPLIPWRVGHIFTGDIEMIRMRRRSGCLPVLGAIALSLAVVPTQASAQFDGPDAEVVRAREIAFAQTMADRDIEAFVTFISPEAVFFNGNRPLRGHEGILEDWARYFDAEIAPFSWRPDLVQVLESGELALSSGPVLSAAGEPGGRFNSIWKKHSDGQWYVIFDKGS